MSWQSAMVLTAVLMSGCLEHAVSTKAPEAPAHPSDAALKSGVNLLPINYPTTFVVVKTPRAHGRIMTRENPGEVDSTAKELFLRIIDANGTFHDRTFIVPAKGRGAITEFEFDYPTAAPYIVTAECGCVLAWLMNTELDPNVALGDPGLLRNETASIILHYEPSSPDDVAGKEALHDEDSFAMNESIIHWGFAWENNMHGNASLVTPHGRQLAHWQLDGRATTGGHVSNGSTPLEVGDWRVSMSGVGWFQLVVKQVYLPKSSWQVLGVAAPTERPGDQNETGLSEAAS